MVYRALVCLLGLGTFGCQAPEDALVEEGGGSTDASTTGGGALHCSGGAEGWGGDGDDGGAEDSSFGMGDDLPLAATVYDVQTGVLGPGDLIVLTDVVVTSPSSRGDSGASFEIFVQDPRGGTYSGLRLRTVSFDPGDMLAPGDAADIVGHVREQDGFFVLEPRSSGDVTPRGTGVVPPPVLVAVAELEPDQETARAYEGVSVRVEAVTVTQPDACDGEFVVDDTLHIDDRFVVDALPSTTKGQVLPAIAGVLIHGPSIYKLAPPDAGAFE